MIVNNQHTAKERARDDKITDEKCDDENSLDNDEHFYF